MTNQSSTHSIYSWFNKISEQLSRLNKTDFPQSVLFTGAQGIGREQFILRLIQDLLCQNSKSAACGQCQSCHLFKSKNHADFYQLNRLENKQSIGVDQIRSVIDWVELSATLDQGKVLFIREADKLSRSASNAILKTLEEPPANTIIILLCEYEKQLLPTIRSRCVHFLLATPKKEQARDFLINWNNEQANHINDEQINTLLTITQNAPFKAIALFESNKLEHRQTMISALTDIAVNQGSPVLATKEIIKVINKEPLDYVLYCLLTILIDIIKIQSMKHSKHLMNIDYHQELIRFANLISLHEQKSQLFAIYDELQSFFTMTINPLNSQLLLESVLIKWKNCCLNRVDDLK